MAGVTDLPFRNICRKLGVGLTVSEMLSADQSLWDTHKSSSRLCFDEGEDMMPRSVQIAGADPEMLAAAALAVQQAGADIVDINMGCPAKKVCRKAAGSALMRDESLVAEILQRVVGEVQIPVTLKIRTGWSPSEKNAVSIAKIAEESGVSALTVHGRSRACKFVGAVEYDTIAAVKQAVSIPVIANGDIDCAKKACRIIDYTGADAVMIGRAALGKPWLLNQIAQYLLNGVQLNNPSVQDVRNLLLEHLDGIHAFYGDYRGVRIARKHVSWYLQDYAHSQPFRRRFNSIDNVEQQRVELEEYFETLITEGEQAA
jgi:tRNA-dihydrouridine synthase B